MSLRRVVLDEREIPQVWYNLQADLPEPLPNMLHPVTRNPLVPDDLAAIFPPGLIEQELSRERYIDIPGEVMDIYRSWRPTPLIRALKLEQLLETPAHIYYKYEGT
ncbi:MAG: TrpB-like pyridoxal-phosphate dependent enzyme, partial [Syntrophaceticus sp.]|nr:TrpB-like pyridoxal-phosphate dependent enzyme [Syntrophaceticus sp.]